ncbi:MAG: N-acetylmuramoyl-L-alanine amidase [Clostridia bacterium]|nr:N-acetylmuramoyl-L-alanine amidase [Clostridia bacterium]
MKKFLFLLIISVLLLSGCSDSPEDNKTDTPDTTHRTTVTEKETEPLETPSKTEEATAETKEETVPETTEETSEQTENTLSSLSSPDFMLPFESYSWEREYPVEYVVLHFTSNVVADKTTPYSIQAVKKIFEDSSISSNYIIDRDGSIFCFVPENYAAWHAGVGTYADDEKYTNKMNKYSIGIEMLAIGSYSDMQFYLTQDEYDSLDKSLIGFSDEQYEALKKLVRDVCERNGIPFDRAHVIGHDEYNPNKNDPGELFDWDRLFE